MVNNFSEFGVKWSVSHTTQVTIYRENKGVDNGCRRLYLHGKWSCMSDFDQTKNVFHKVVRWHFFSRTAERFVITEISSGFYLPNSWNWLIFDWAIRKIKMSVFETRFLPMRFELLSEVVCAVDTLQCSEDFTVGDGREIGRRSRSSQTVAASNRVGRWKDDG